MITTLDLADDEACALATRLRQTLDYQRNPLAPQLDQLKAILAKLEPPILEPERLPPLKPRVGPTHGRRRSG